MATGVHAGRRAGTLLRRLLAEPTSVPRPFAPPYRSYSALPSVAHETITLPDQRTLCYTKYGAADGDGYPVLYFHGHPGSRLEANLFHEDAKELGITLISIDRPGIGHSTPQPGRTPSDHAKDVNQLVNHLNLKDYKILAVSGGGPYGLASARFSSTRLRAVALLAGMVWLPNIGLRGMRLGNKLLFYGSNYTPSLLRWLARLLVSLQLNISDEALAEIAAKQLKGRLVRIPGNDRALLADGTLLKRTLPSTREHFRQGADGFMDEARILTSDLDFDLAQIDRLPILLWYGKEDINVPPTIGCELAKRIGKNARLNNPDETHLGLLMNHKKRILEDLLSRE